MEKSITLLEKTIKNQSLTPKKQTIDNILNYSKSIDVFSTKIGVVVVVNN